MGLFSSLFTSKNKKNQMIDCVIETLGKAGSIMGTAYDEISYDDVISYIKENNCQILNVIDKPRGKWIEFRAIVKGSTYTVTLNKTFEGSGSVLSSRLS